MVVFHTQMHPQHSTDENALLLLSFISMGRTKNQSTTMTSKQNNHKKHIHFQNESKLNVCLFVCMYTLWLYANNFDIDHKNLTYFVTDYSISSINACVCVCVRMCSVKINT